MANLALLDSDQGSPAVTIDTARAIASEYIARAADPEDFDAELVLRERPELRDHKSVVLDLAYEEFLRKAEAGHAPQVSQFAARFPEWQVSLLRMLQVHDFLNASPDLTTITWPQVDDNFAGFQLCQELGRGAFSRVFLARELGVGGRTVVVKAVSNVYSDANTLGRLQHPHLVPVYSVSHDEAFGLTAICMPYLGRATLFDVLQTAFDEEPACPRQGIVLHEAIEQANQNDEELLTLRREYPYSGMNYVDAVLEIAIQLAQALKYIHRRGIYHCDIKPSNVLLTASGEAKLFDFNLALADDTPPEQVGGTLAYMAPELLESFADGRPAGDIKIDGRTDLFSFGVMLFELLTGKLPFEMPSGTDDRRELARQLLRQQVAGPAPLSKLNPAVNRQSVLAIEKCLKSDPAFRPVSAVEFLELLQRSRAHTRQVSRRRFAATVVIGGLLVGSSAAAILLYPDRNQTPLARAQEAFSSGRYSEAVKFFNQAHQDDPTNLRIQFLLGQAYLYAGSFSEALEWYLRVKESGLDDPELTTAIARAHFHYGRELALAGWFHGGGAAAAHNQFRYGLQTLQRLGESDQEQCIFRAYNASCIAGQGGSFENLQLAIKLFKFSAKLPQLENVAHHNNIGYCQYRVGVRQRAAEDFEAAIASFDSANNSLESAIERDESQHTPYRNLAYLCRERFRHGTEVKNILDWAARSVAAIRKAVETWEGVDEPYLGPSALYYEATLILACAAGSASAIDAGIAKEYRQSAIGYARRALRAGLSFDVFRGFSKDNDATLVWNDPDFQGLAVLDQKKGAMDVKHNLIMDPLTESYDQATLGRLYLSR